MARRSFKIAACLLGLFLFLLSAACLHAIMVFGPKRKRRAFSFLNMRFARFLCAVAGVRCVVHGRENIPDLSGCVVISNHLTYLDGVIIGSVFPVVYLSKEAIKKWPLVSWMASISGTIFVDREHKSAALQPLRIWRFA